MVVETALSLEYVSDDFFHWVRSQEQRKPRPLVHAKVLNANPPNDLKFSQNPIISIHLAARFDISYAFVSKGIGMMRRYLALSVTWLCLLLGSLLSCRWHSK